MDAKTKDELISIRTELNSIIRELESISDGVRDDFTGIGSDKCANCIDNVVAKYNKAKKLLDEIDTSK